MPHQEPASTAQQQQSADALIDTILQATPRGLTTEQNQSFQQFLPLYLSGLPATDLAGTNAEDLNGLSLAHWRLAQFRLPAKTNIQVSNPVIEHDGWQSPHTIVQIVTEDQPHLVASLRSALLEHGKAIHLVLHPLLGITRDENNQCRSIENPSHKVASETKSTSAGKQNSLTESLIHIEIDGVDENELTLIHALVERTLNILHLLREDASTMTTRLRALGDQHVTNEQSAFVAWLAEKDFSCLGLAEIEIGKDNNAGTLISKNGLGLLSTKASDYFVDIEELIPNNTVEAIDGIGNNIVICKASSRSPVMRSDYPDLILLVKRDKKQKVIGLDCVLGLFASGLQAETTDTIPLLRERVENAIDASNTAPESHDGKALANVLRGFPKDMLLQSTAPALLQMAQGIVALHERNQIRLFHSNDLMGRFYNCLVFIPRETYSRELRLDIESTLMDMMDGKSIEFHMQFSSETALARLHFAVQRNPPLTRKIDWHGIEQRITLAAITWNDRLLETLRTKHAEHDALALYARYSNAFPANYREDYSARIAVSDITFIEARQDKQAPVMSFYRHIVADSGTINFKLFSYNQPVSLSDVIPVIENMGLRVESEHPFEIKRAGEAAIWMHEFTVEQIGSSKLDSKTSAQYIQSAFTHIWNGDVENDGFNRLILEAGLTHQQVVILRSYCKYLLQIGVPFSQAYMIDSLVANSDISSLIVEFFESRFDTARHERDGQIAIEKLILEALDEVASLDEDRILRAYLNLIKATVRTNAYCIDSNNNPRPYLSFKFNCALIADLPLPRPMAEIFVYSAQFEGIHLRGGKVARGGLRWSDRREDFRTEVLGLMKAQMVKNAVIVPVGSKGGFYVKMTLSEEREKMMEQVVGCYQNFLRGLLDLTDNIVADAVVPASNVVRYDSDDPYLVVAADKGTATFSDFANEVSKQYDFWLGDAFASGGSVGYDHKKMGITARGAWESVKRHFRELGHDTQTENFTVAGIGDMAGDVFGNGMLLSPHIQLLAAFNHMHIFIDPSPDATATFEERKRLFALPRSSWEDYNQQLISKGGGIYLRSDKKIVLSVEAQKALGVEIDTFTPNQLINHILKAPVDLLWNGGIGTYVKASSESHADAADRANDAVRVNANELRCRVVGEGGNLGCTQRARIEYSRAGGMMYTDAIDNSAGVDCSDHEVNIKILLNSIVSNDDMTLKQRDNLLASMTDEVGELVLRDNYLQTQCINQCFETRSASLDESQRFMLHLESIGKLDRSIEFLPDNEQVADLLAANEGLSKPEIAVLVSYSKMVMYDDLLATDFADEPALQKMLRDYFPTDLRVDFMDRIATHRLRREIVTTIVTNELVNRLGPTFVFRIQQELGTNVKDIAAAFVAVRAIFQLPELWASIEDLDNRVSAAIQNQMQILVKGLVERATHWVLRSRRGTQSIDQQTALFEPGISALIAAMPDCLADINRETLDQRVAFFVNAGVPEATAMAVSQVVPLSSSLDIVEIAESVNSDISTAAKVYFELGNHLELQWLREQIGELQVRSHWHTLSKSELRSDLHYQQRHLVAEVISSAGDSLSSIDMVERWSKANNAAVSKYSDLIVDMKASSSVDFAMLSLGVNEVHKLLRSDRPLAAG